MHKYIIRIYKICVNLRRLMHLPSLSQTRIEPSPPTVTHSPVTADGEQVMLTSARRCPCHAAPQVSVFVLLY